MTLKYPAVYTDIETMCTLIKFLGIKSTEYTDCTILYEVTFDQLRTVYNMGRESNLQNNKENATLC